MEPERSVLQSAKQEGAGDLKSTLTSDMEMQSLGLPSWLLVSLAQCFLTMLPFLPFGMTECILGHCVLGVYALLSRFTGVTVKSHESQKRLRTLDS